MAHEPYPRRIVCLTEETTETLYLLGEQDRIVGISGFTVRPPEARKTKPKVSLFTSADLPQIETLNPDLVVGFSDLQADIARDLVKAGHNVVIFNQRSVDEILQTVVMTGALVGKQREAEALADRLRRNLDRVAQASADSNHRPRVFFEEWPDPLIHGIRWVSELIEVAGGRDVFEDNRQSGLAKQRIVEPAVVAERDPEVIVASWCGKMVKPERIRKREGWEQVSAVKHDRIHEIPSAAILQPGPAALTDGLKALRACIEAALTPPP